MKCTQCGCKELTLVGAPFSADYFKTSEALKIYACNECGHLEFFENSWNETRKELMSKLQLLESKQRQISQKIEEKEKPIVELKKKIQKLEEQKAQAQNHLQQVLANKDITVREQENTVAELKAQMQTIDAEIQKISRAPGPNTGSLHIELQNIEKEIEGIKKSLEQPYLKFARWN